ncbi:MAG: hypothetical protein UHX00_10655 [Caryophanon sp.]|nr:hypothetical protein [Caryophanon sp.]
MKKKMDIAVGLYVIVIFLYFLYIQFTDATLQQHALTLLFGGGLILNGVYELLVNGRKKFGTVMIVVAVVVVISSFVLNLQ